MAARSLAAPRACETSGRASRRSWSAAALAGITAALDCARAGAEVTLLEVAAAARRRGVLVRRATGLTLDNGQHVFLRCCTAYRDAARADRRQRPGHAAAAARRSRCSPPAAPAGVAAPLGACRRRCTSPERCCATRYLASRERLARRRWPMHALARRGSRRPRRRRAHVRRLARRARPEPSGGDATVGADRAPDAQPPCGRRVARARPRTCSSAGCCATDARRHRLRRVPLSRDPRRRGAARARARPASRSVWAGARERDRRRSRGGAVRVEARGVTAAAPTRSIVAVPPARAAALLPGGARRRPRGAGGARHLADRQPARRLRPPRVRAPVRRRGRHAGAVDVRSHRRAPAWSAGSTWRSRCRPPTASCRATVDELRERFVPALAELLPARARGARSSVLRHPRARGDVPRRARARALRPGPRTAIPGWCSPARWTDTGWPATMEGAVRSGHAAAAAHAAPLGRARAPHGSAGMRRWLA